MEINLDSASIQDGISDLGRLGREARAASNVAHQVSLDASYSGVSGLDQLGSGHGGVLAGGPGSAVGILESYAQQIEWLEQALNASATALTGQNTFVSRGMEIADEGGYVGADSVSFPQRPFPRFENFSFTPPMVAPALSIDQLSREFSTTKIAASTAAAATWRRLSAAVSGVATGLSGVAAKLSGQNSGDVITAAVDKISEVAAAGETFVMNSDVMATSVEQLAAIKSQGAVQVNLARAALTAIPNPVERQAAEQAFLATFPASFSPSVITGVPPIRNLMSMDGSVDGGGQIALGMDDVAGEGRTRVDGLRAAGMAANILGQVGALGSTGQFGGVDEGVSQLAGIAGVPATMTPATASAVTANAEGLETVTAGLNTISTGASPNVSPSAGSGGLPPGPAGLNNSAFGTPMGPLGQAGAAGTSTTGVAGATRGNATLSGTPVLGAAGAPGGTGALGNRGTIGMPPGAVTGAGAPRPMTGSGLGGGSGSGAAVNGGAGAPRGLAAAGGQPGGAPFGGASAGTAGTSAGQGRGMMPMMGAPMAGAGNSSAKTTKVRTVTSAVEEGENLTALLGERGPVVPGVIGAWVRD